nr:HAMP domain-containing sensor histidine kinase [Kordiimonas marina]
MLTAYGIYKWLPAVHQVSHEIERRKTAEAELRTLLEEVNLLARQAEEANRSKSEFLATMSHELRTPLNAVIGFTEMLQADMYTEPEKRNEFLGIVADSGRHLLNIINDILDLSRLEAGKIAINAAPFQLCQLMQECVSYTEPRILEKGLGIGLDCDVDGMVSDRRLLKQILLNLLSNAVKFTPNGGHVGLTATGTDKNVVIKVTDSGIGMTAEEIRRAMEPFVQIDNSLARAHEGTGLGLPLVERFTTLLEGRMEIFSEKGQGTTITLTIPRTVSTEAETPGALI